MRGTGTGPRCEEIVVVVRLVVKVVIEVTVVVKSRENSLVAHKGE